MSEGLTVAMLLRYKQPPVTEAQVTKASKSLARYRIMAFVTGIVLFAGTVALIIKYATNLHVEPWTGYLWLAHGYLYLVYVIFTAILGVKLRWPLARYVLVMLAGTIPTMSFVAEHFVTRATRESEQQNQPVDVRD
jgi:integral membrane protein